MNTTVPTPPAGTVRDWVDAQARDHANDPAYVFSDGAPGLRWVDLKAEAARLAAHLTANGVAKGESIAILQPNGRGAIISLFGCLYGGFRATMINLVAGDSAIGYALEHCEARVALVGDAQVEMFDRVAPDGLVRADVNGQDAGDTLHSIVADDHALLMYTSGTTGRPKGVLHSHASLLAGGWTTTVAHALTAQDRGMCVLPIYHINGLCVTVMGTLISGGSLVVVDRFSTSAFWDQASEHQVTWFSVVPTIISHLLHGAADPDAGTVARLRFGRSASSPLAPDVQTAFENRFSVPIVETMGLTETAAQITSNPLPPGVRKIGSPGVAAGNKVAILRKDFSNADPMEQGEIAISGPNVMLGYLNNPEATAGAFTADGWLRTGDLGHLDADGFLFVTGRLKELIIKGGENIAPREVDEALYSHGDVIEAAAFARACKKYGERVEAAVKVRDGSSLTESELIAICASKLGGFKSPDKVFIMDDLPKGPSGKIQRLKLAEITG